MGVLDWEQDFLDKMKQDRDVGWSGVRLDELVLGLALVVVVCEEPGGKKGTSGGGRSDGVLDYVYV